MKKVFVTGGSGFVGKNLIPLLIRDGCAVNALARSDKAVKEIEDLCAFAIKGAIKDAIAIEKGLKGCDTVYHLAASTDTFATKAELYDLNVAATLQLLNLAKKSGLKNFVYLGAASVIMNGKPIDNADEGFVSDNLVDGYSKTKLGAENLVLSYNSDNFKTISLRPH